MVEARQTDLQLPLAEITLTHPVTFLPISGAVSGNGLAIRVDARPNRTSSGACRALPVTALGHGKSKRVGPSTFTKHFSYRAGAPPRDSVLSPCLIFGTRCTTPFPPLAVPERWRKRGQGVLPVVCQSNLTPFMAVTPSALPRFGHSSIALKARKRISRQERRRLTKGDAFALSNRVVRQPCEQNAGRTRTLQTLSSGKVRSVFWRDSLFSEPFA